MGYWDFLALSIGLHEKAGFESARGSVFPAPEITVVQSSIFEEGYWIVLVASATGNAAPDFLQQGLCVEVMASLIGSCSQVDIVHLPGESRHIAQQSQFGTFIRGHTIGYGLLTAGAAHFLCLEKGDSDVRVGHCAALLAVNFPFLNLAITNEIHNG
jgi:hypothetical protein